MKIFYAYNNEFKDILENFLSSMKDDWELMEFQIDDFKSKGQMAGGREADLMRKNLLDFAFNKTQNDEIFVMSDIDIIFYKECIPIIKEEFLKTQTVKLNNIFNNVTKDIIFQREHMDRGVNMGFMAMKNNNKIQKFWNDVYDISLKEKSWDQPIVNNLLYQNLLERSDNYSSYKDNSREIWDVFPKKIWNWSIGNVENDICLHHANCAVTKKAKQDQFNYIKNIINIT